MRSGSDRIHRPAPRIRAMSIGSKPFVRIPSRHMFSFPSPLRSLLLSVLLTGAGSVWAQPKTPPPPQPQPQPATAPQPPASQSQSKGNRTTLPDSVRRVERQTGGEVLRAEPMQRDGREVYRLKVLTADGRVRVVQDDPSNNGNGKPPARKNDKDKEPPGDPDGDPPQY